MQVRDLRNNNVVLEGQLLELNRQITQLTQELLSHADSKDAYVALSCLNDDVPSGICFSAPIVNVLRSELDEHRQRITKQQSILHAFVHHIIPYTSSRMRLQCDGRQQPSRDAKVVGAAVHSLEAARRGVGGVLCFSNVPSEYYRLWCDWQSSALYVQSKSSASSDNLINSAQAAQVECHHLLQI